MCSKPSSVVGRTFLHLFSALIVSCKTTVIDVITAPEKINSTSEWRIFRTQKLRLNL